MTETPDPHVVEAERLLDIGRRNLARLCGESVDGDVIGESNVANALSGLVALVELVVGERNEALANNNKSMCSYCGHCAALRRAGSEGGGKP